MKQFHIERYLNPKWTWRLGSKPDPFPGQWPTRLFLRHDESKFLYLGKPSIPQVQRFNLLVQKLGLNIWDCAVEFDRGGAVYTHTGQKGTAHTGNLFQLYHHWNYPDSLARHLTIPLHCKRLGGQSVYSPWQTLPPGYDEAFLQWLADFLGGKLKAPAPEPSKKKANQLEEILERYAPPLRAAQARPGGIFQAQWNGREIFGGGVNAQPAPEPQPAQQQGRRALPDLDEWNPPEIVEVRD
jgi:hypothetical protein